jgi:hypothetical protein
MYLLIEPIEILLCLNSTFDPFRYPKNDVATEGITQETE